MAANKLDAKLRGSVEVWEDLTTAWVKKKKKKKKNPYDQKKKKRKRKTQENTDHIAVL